MRNQEKGIFISERESSWTPTASEVPIKVNTMDGSKTWKGQYCYGVQKFIPYPPDGTFQNFVLALDTWEA
eukprot:15013200-Ditylum_brightwellii.AAC.1